jgi:dTDP-4-amino-4,6-dideoxygalactose transaminase
MINFGKPSVGEAELDLLGEVVTSGIFVHGEKTELFEKSFGKRFGYDQAVSVSSCTAGLHLAHFSLLRERQKRPSGGKPLEVICPAMTHVATAHAIELAGLKPVFIDCDPFSGNLDVEALAAAVSRQTVGIAAMHFNGLPCDMKKVMSIANDIGAYVVEDCAISLNASIDNIPVGLWGDVGCFSFHPVKQMTTGEGGMIVTRDGELASRLRIERAFGVDRAFNERAVPGVYDVPSLGFNYRMSELSAAIGCAQLAKFQDLEERRERNFTHLLERLLPIDGIEVKGATRSEGRGYYTLIAQVASGVERRNEIINALRSRGVQPSVYYPHPVPRLKYYKDKYGYESSNYRNAEIFSDRCIALSIGAHLGSSEIDRMADLLIEVLLCN